MLLLDWLQHVAFDGSNKKDSTRTHIYELDTDSSVSIFAVNFVVVRDMNCSKNCVPSSHLIPAPFGTGGSYPY